MIRLAAGLLPETFRTLRECGRAECECGVFWTGPSSDDLADAVEHPLHNRSPFGYEVDSEWITQLWKRLAASRRSIKAQVHSHPEEAFHSCVDDQWPVISQPGFISIVIPDFATGDPSLNSAWIGCLQPDGRWRRLKSASEVIIT